MLALGHVMVDPAPFGGGVTSLEALSMCVPVVTAPRSQTVPGLTAGIVRSLQIPAAVQDELVAASDDAYVAATVRLLVDMHHRDEVGEAICAAYSPVSKDKALAEQVRENI
jgi:predicted O-linked N-acetylglucosamine transferase (SPINDLY family)